jgi:hypothetical protein
MDRKIVWEKWYDPLQSAIDDYKSLLEDSFQEHFHMGHMPDEMLLDRPFPIRGPVVVTNMGMVPIHEDNTPAKIFNFWIGHTNFDIDEQVSKKICETPGVEVFNVWTRYRFRLGIGKVFQDREVMADIDRMLTNRRFGINQQRLINMVADSLKKRHRQFYLTKDDKGNIQYSPTKTEAELIYEWNPKEKVTKEGSNQRGITGGNEEQRQLRNNKKRNK